MKNAERTRLNTGTTRIAMGALLLLSLVGCVTRPMPALSNATLTPPTRTTRDLTHLPPPKGKIVAAVYGFRDLTGQYKASPDSSFSSQVTQGGASFLVKAMRDSGWFTPVERENLQDLLTERKIMRATDGADAKKAQNDAMAPLMPANIVLEGGIVGYDTNVRTGGAGVAYPGSAGRRNTGSTITVNLRAIDIRTGQVLNSVSTTKTVYSYQVDTGIYRFVGFRTCCRRKPG